MVFAAHDPRRQCRIVQRTVRLGANPAAGIPVMAASTPGGSPLRVLIEAVEFLVALGQSFPAAAKAVIAAFRLATFRSLTAPHSRFAA
jgi:hypothetical protein